MPRPLRRLTVVLVGLCLTAGAAGAQRLTLEEAVRRAVEESLPVRSARLQTRGTEIGLRASELERYPNLAFRANGGVQFGLNVDPTTNDAVQQRTGFASGSVDLGVPIYQGGRLNAAIAQNRAQLAADQASVEASEQDVALDVANRYLTSLLRTEDLRAARSQRADAEAELDRTRRLIAAGTLAPAQEVEAASALSRQASLVVAAENALALAELNLRQLLRFGPDEPLNLIDPSQIDFDAVTLPPVQGVELYQAAVSRQPGVRAAELAAEAAEAGERVARAGFYPSVNGFAQLDTRYSSRAVQPVGDVELEVVEQEVFIDGNPVSVGFQQPVFRTENIPVGQQLQDFFGQAVGLSVNVPIFNNGRTRAAVQRAELAVEQARLTTERERLTLEIEVEQALQAARAARAEVEAAQRALAAAENAYAAAQRRAELGAGSAFDLTNAQLLLEQARATELNARYQFLFNAKVVDFYLGRPLTLD